jgi:hypothetical protein
VSNPLRLMSRIGRQVWTLLAARSLVRRPSSALLHDPAASCPHDLDDPFFDPKVQERVAHLLVGATRKQKDEKENS